MVHFRIIPHHVKVFAVVSLIICFCMAAANASDTRIAVPCNLETKKCSGLDGYFGLICIPSNKEKRRIAPDDTESYYPHRDWGRNRRFFISVKEQKFMRPYGIMNDIFIFWEMNATVYPSSIRWRHEIWDPKGLLDSVPSSSWSLNRETLELFTSPIYKSRKGITDWICELSSEEAIVGPWFKEYYDAKKKNKI